MPGARLTASPLDQAESLGPACPDLEVWLSLLSKRSARLPCLPVTLARTAALRLADAPSVRTPNAPPSLNSNSCEGLERSAFPDRTKQTTEARGLQAPRDDPSFRCAQAVEEWERLCQRGSRPATGPRTQSSHASLARVVSEWETHRPLLLRCSYGADPNSVRRITVGRSLGADAPYRSC